MVKRVADEVDRKIAYIEMTDYAMERYDATKKCLFAFTGKCVERMGEERFEQMCDMLDEFLGIIEDENRKTNIIIRRNFKQGERYVKAY